ncbi:hypothetical protein TetV_473 [Tetraselmis virus 1]|uniref:Uncharacterized protein n=1 Tax=Tetraselmis virus 1 TaxID=2060617 RepID=A0A2P0VNR9_9VIRU|nr:hypothetical protein QJ968_gp581 [Tetraselmis virus 1]AUF82555.1 hypothetical protein TetV_473 [Tetraselmis virus 1]
MPQRRPNADTMTKENIISEIEELTGESRLSIKTLKHDLVKSLKDARIKSNKKKNRELKKSVSDNVESNESVSSSDNSGM